MVPIVQLFSHILFENTPKLRHLIIFITVHKPRDKLLKDFVNICLSEKNMKVIVHLCLFFFWLHMILYTLSPAFINYAMHIVVFVYDLL